MENSISTIFMVLMVYFLLYVAQTTSFHLRKVLSGSEYRKALYLRVFHTLDAKYRDILALCGLAYSSFASYSIFHSALS